MRHVVLLSLSMLLASCAVIAPQPTPAPTITVPPPVTVAPLSTNTPIPSPTPTPAPPVQARAKYTLDATIDYDAHTVRVKQIIEYPNHTGSALQNVVFAAVPNLWDGFALENIRINDTPISTYTLEGQRLDIPLPAALLPESLARIELDYSLTLPFAEQEDPNIARPRIYGYTKRQLNLVNWYPFVVPYLNGEWVLHDPWFYGEHLVYEAADYVVDVRFTDPANAPIVAASGEPFPQADSTRYTLQSARTFALAASREFQVASTQVGDVTVSSYYFPIYQQGGKDVLKASAEALMLYSEVYGAYKHKTLSVVMGDFNDGMEYSAFFYLSRDFYNLHQGTPDNYLTFVAVHETAHQWWFDQVANDQAQQPWVDESLCTYSELLYYETYHPNLVDWWWSYRINYYNPQGFVDIPIYEGQGFRPYTNAAYFQGAHFLHDLRGRIGDDAFFAFLKDYNAQGQEKIVTAQDFFNILKGHTQTDYTDLVRQYFRSVYP